MFFITKGVVKTKVDDIDAQIAELTKQEQKQLKKKKSGYPQVKDLIEKY